MKKITEAIVLVGGFGTRLQHIVSDVPKPMAPINGTPFLSYTLEKLMAWEIEHVILSTGHLHEKIEEYYGNQYKNLTITYSHEKEPLGTGGAILFALDKANTNNVLVLNGDTLFDIDFASFNTFFQEKNTLLAVALRKVNDMSRYGAVLIDKTEKIVDFIEKNEQKNSGFINGGIYLLNKALFTQTKMPEKFSFEKDILEKLYTKINIYGLAFDAYFIDIGTPEDYARAQNEFPILERK